MNGAIGNFSAAFGQETVARNISSFTVGQYNIGINVNTIVEVGIGDSEANRKNALEIYNDGHIYVPELTIDNIDNDQSLVTKEYIDKLDVVFYEQHFDVTDTSRRDYSVSLNGLPSECDRPIEVFNNGILLRRGRDYTRVDNAGVITITLNSTYTTNIGDWLYVKIPYIQYQDCSAE